MPYRSLQVGLSGEAVDRYVDEWTVGIADITADVRRIQGLPDGDRAAALPSERPYPLPDDVATAIGAT